jgi:hypothetical protein
MNKKIFAIALCFGLNTTARAQQFEDYFEDATLRIDYIFAGNHEQQEIYLDELNKTPKWAGRRHNLCDLPLEGNGQITVKDKETNQIIYKHSFSTLFQEWLVEEEATRLKKSFENTFQIPFPKNNIIVEVKLLDTHRNVSCSYIHEVDPKDPLIAQRGYGFQPQSRTLIKSGDLDKCIDIAIVAEGYTKEEIETFYYDARIATESLFEHEPFKKNKNKFNIVAVACESKDSGVSIPQNNVWKNTALSSHFDTFYSDRYLTTLHLKELHNTLAGIPYEHIIILANTSEYGGGGIYNSYTLTAAHHRDFRPVVVHEFGHSFGGLADEYFYDDDVMTDTYPKGVEPWEPNVTTLVDFDSKWKKLLPKDTPIPTSAEDRERTIGVYEGGAYSSKGIYRGAFNCRMRTNHYPTFCAVCEHALREMIDFYTK